MIHRFVDVLGGLDTLPFSLLEGTASPENADQTNVWMVIKGRPVRLTPYTDGTNGPFGDEMHSPKLSPDGTLVAYTDFAPSDVGDGSQRLYVVAADGSSTLPVSDYYTQATGDWLNHACWSPDGDKIVLTDGSGGNGGLSAGGKIVEVTYPGGSSTDLWTPQTQSPTQRESGNSPQYSPDGTKICFFVNIASGGGGTLSRQGLWVMDSDGTNATQLDNWSSASADHGYLLSGTQAAWSHDSQWIAYVDRGFSGGGTFSVYKIKTDGTSKTLLADGSSGTIRHYIAHDAWLDDDSAVICTERSGAGRMAIISAASDGSGTTQLIANTDGPLGTQNFETAIRDTRNNRINWIYKATPDPVIIRTCAIDGTDVRNTYAPVEATVASGTGFEWV